jgi:hypothetical protein
LEIELQRRHFTQHGQHLNYIGKELVANELANLILQHFTKVETEIIQMEWKDDNLHEMNLIAQITNIQENPAKSNKVHGKNVANIKKKILKN